MNSAVAFLSPPRYQSSRCQIKPGWGKERENKAQKEEGRGRTCVVGVPLVLEFPLFPAIFAFKLFPLQLGFLFEVGCVVTPEVVTLSVALGPLLLGREEECPLFRPCCRAHLGILCPCSVLSTLCGHVGDSGGCESAILKTRWLFLSS